MIAPVITSMAIGTSRLLGSSGADNLDQFRRNLAIMLESAGKLLELIPPFDCGELGCILGTACGTAVVAEYVTSTLDGPGHRFLDPEAFLVFSPHGVTAQVAISTKAAGFCATLLGPASGNQVLLAAIRRLALGRESVVLCGAFEWPTSFGLLALSRMGEHPMPVMSGYSLLTLEDRETAVSRGARILSTVDVVELESAIERAPATASSGWTGLHDLGPALRPFVALAEQIRRSGGPVMTTEDLDTTRRAWP